MTFAGLTTMALTRARSCSQGRWSYNSVTVKQTLGRTYGVTITLQYPNPNPNLM